MTGFSPAASRNTFASEPPAAYNRPFESTASAQIYAKSGSANDLNSGAGIKFPSLRSATPFFVPLSKSSKLDCSQNRVWSALAATAQSITTEARNTKVSLRIECLAIILEWGSLYGDGNVLLPGNHLIHRNRMLPNHRLI